MRCVTFVLAALLLALVILTSVGGAAGPDILAVTAYSLTDCLKACASFNRNANTNDECKGVVFDAQLSYAHIYAGTCFLKRSTDGQSKETDPDLANLWVAGILLP